MAIRIIQGDCRIVMHAFPSESVHCVITSPPYWGLRDYGVDGQLGLEPTVAEYLTSMREVFREVHRVLRADGTLWLNMGDTYASSVNGRSAADTKAIGNDDRTFRDKPFGTVDISAKLKPKDLVGMPWRLAFALQEDGWWLRSDIIWAKPNPMPESITDRPTKSHEYLFLLSKSSCYYYDADAIREPHIYAHDARNDGERHTYAANAKYNQIDKDRQHTKTDAVSFHPLGRNKRTVWDIPTAPYVDAHFATFPPALVEPCIKAGCPLGGVILDPFFGAGTSGLVADRLGRDCIGIELNPKYAELAEKRIYNDAPLFADIIGEESHGND